MPASPFWPGATGLLPRRTCRSKISRSRPFYVASANLLLALVVALLQKPGRLTWSIFWLPFTATHRVGIAKAFGIWAPVNIIVSIFWGALLFHEFLNVSLLLLLWVVAIIAGVLLIIFARSDGVKAQGAKV